MTTAQPRSAPLSAQQLSKQLGVSDTEAVTQFAEVLVALGVITKRGESYVVENPERLEEVMAGMATQGARA